MRRSGWLIGLFLAAAVALAAPGEERLTRVFDSSYDFWDCDWSPDGQRLALAGKNYREPAEKSRIWLYTVGAEKPILWTNTENLCDDWPRWSPDGRRLALVRRELQGRRLTCIWWKDVESGAGMRLTKGPDDRQPSWSPDGKAIVFRRGLGPEESALALLDTGTYRVTLLPVPPGLLGEPFWGVDGIIYYTRYQLVPCETKIQDRVYKSQVISGGRLWYYDPATGRGGPLLREEFDQRMPALSPDGKWLAFYGQVAEKGQAASIPDPAGWALFLRNQANGELTRLAGNVALTGGPPVWSKDSRTTIVYRHSSSQPSNALPALWSCLL